MEKKDGKKAYKGVVKSPLREIQNGCQIFGIILTDKKIHIKHKELI